MSLESVCPYKKNVPFTINIYSKEDRERLSILGQQIAQQEGIKFEGYYLDTQEPYSVEAAKATLFFE